MGHDMRRRLTRLRPTRALLAGTLAAIGLTIIVLAFLVWASQGFRPLPASLASGLLSMGAGAFAASIHIIIGWRLATRLPGNAVGWLVLAGGLTFAMVIPIGLLVGQAQQAFRPAPALTLNLAWFQSSFGIPVLVAANLIAGMLYPDGHFVGSRWRIGGALAVAGPLLIGSSAALDPAGLVWYPTLPNPYAMPWETAGLVDAVRFLGVLLVLAATGVLVASVVHRYRAGDRIVREQLRWITRAVALEVVLFAAFVMTRYVLLVREDVGELLVAMAEASSAALPIAAALAITRHHLFGVDVLISRTLFYVALMAILGGMSTGIAALTQRLFIGLTGEPSEASVVIAVFLAAAVYTPVRRGLEGFLDQWTKGGMAGAAAPDEHELHETAAALVALRDFEERLASPASAVRPGTSGVAQVPIRDGGRVPCPMGSSVPITTCLGCERLVSIAPSSRTVQCAIGASDML